VGRNSHSDLERLGGGAFWLPRPPKPQAKKDSPGRSRKEVKNSDATSPRSQGCRRLICIGSQLKGVALERFQFPAIARGRVLR
jgi:hypothetical protein